MLPENATYMIERTAMSRIVRGLLILGVGFALIPPIALAQDDPCAGLDLAANEVGLNYEGHCVGVREDGPPVQSIIVSRTEGLDGVEHVTGILVIHTRDGWVIGSEPFWTDRDVAGLEIGDEGVLDMTGDR
jgi:hypothetical protein